MLAAIVGACAACRSREGAIAGAAVFALGLCVFSGFTAVVNPDSVLQSCTVKCSLSGFLYSGAASHGNSLGLILAVALPFVWLAFNGRVRLVLVGYLLINLGLTGSRSSIIAGLVALAVLIITRPGIRDAVVRGRSVSVGVLAAVVAACVSLVLPWLVTDPDFATGRGRLWNLAQGLSTKNLFFGQGSTSWFREYSAGSFGRAAAYSSHNQWVEVTLFLGFVGVILFAAIVWFLLVPSKNRLLVAPILVAIFALGVTERPIALALVDLMSWALFALFMISNCESGIAGHQAKGHAGRIGDSVADGRLRKVPWIRERSVANS
ncbi:O-antigen ligase family protein [Rhodococcoides fascians]|uniref:O-antigen ligase family protein n=1 Tax=Rhodococcoides fascians TaxID=1828 RepID=UPI001E383176|nr:O-antigen ligase family protein [Rhodococcus fascians]